MKKLTINDLVKVLMSLLLVTFLLASCEKNEYTQKFDDVFDTSGVKNLNQKITGASTMDDLYVLFENSGVQAPEALKNVSLEEIVAFYNQNMKLSSDEIDMLLKNDSETYLKVVNRMGSLHPKIKNINIDFDMVRTSPLNSYLVEKIADTENFYSDDYYSAVLAMQDFLKSAVINPMEHLITLPPGKAKGNGHEPDPDAEIDFYKLIASNNIWDIWWTYWTDGTRTKHKGAAGSFPG